MQIPISINHIAAGLAKARQDHTTQTLGDRAEYVGASDIGQCPRKAVLGKTVPKEPDLASLIRFKRGHLAEDIIAEALQAYQPDRQVELTTDIPYCPKCYWWTAKPASGPMHCPDCGNRLRLLPMKAHCDFVFGDDLVLECKSSNSREIRDSWKLQLQMQLFLYEHCHQISPQGCIVVMDLASGSLKVSEPCSLAMEMVPGIIQRGIEIWESVLGAEAAADPEYADSIKTEPGPLCGWCDYLATCPAFQGEDLPDALVGFFEEYLDLCRTEKAAKAEKDTLRDQVLAMLEPGRYMAGDLRVALFERSRTSTDINAISALLEELGQDISDYQKKTPYQVIDVKAD